MLASLRCIAREIDQELAPDSVPWHRLRYEHTSELRRRLIERGLSPSSINKHLCALRGILRECWRLGYMGAEEYARATDIEGLRGERLPAGRVLTPGELRAVCDSCRADRAPTGARDGAIMALSAAAGLRRSEMRRLDREQLAAGAGELRVGGKGGQERRAYLGPGAQLAMREWLGRRGEQPGPLLYPVRKGGMMEPRRLSEGSIYSLIVRRARLAGVAPFTPHDLRRTFVTMVLDAGADTLTAQRLAGHRSPAVTARYDRRGEATQRAAAELVHFPWS